MPDALAPRTQNHTEPGSFFDNIDMVREQRLAMKKMFEQANLDIVMAFMCVRKAYPKFDFEDSMNASNHQLPHITYQAIDVTEKRDKTFAARLAVIFNPDREATKSALRLPSAQAGNAPLFSLVIDVTPSKHYACSLLQTRYRLDRQGGFDAFISDLGLYCGLIYNGDTPMPLADSERAALKPTGRIFGLGHTKPART